MAILIDGYNLLNATGVEGIGRGTELERARRGLLRFLSQALTPQQCAATTIVFDAQGAPPGLPNQESFHGITVLFSKGYAEADDLLEELIATDHSPRNLLVVSGDHRLHRAARRRRATAIDSDVWIEQLESRDPRPTSPADLKHSELPEDDTQHWLAEFSGVDVAALEDELRQQSTAETAVNPDATEPPDPPLPNVDSATDLETERLKNPFPPGFGKELMDELSDEDDLANPFPPEFFEDEDVL